MRTGAEKTSGERTTTGGAATRVAQKITRVG